MFVSMPFLDDGHKKAFVRTGAGCESDCQDGGDVQGSGQRGQSRVIQKLLYRLTTGGLQ